MTVAASQGAGSSGSPAREGGPLLGDSIKQMRRRGPEAPGRGSADVHASVRLSNRLFHFSLAAWGWREKQGFEAGLGEAERGNPQLRRVGVVGTHICFRDTGDYCENVSYFSLLFSPNFSKNMIMHNSDSPSIWEMNWGRGVQPDIQT